MLQIEDTNNEEEVEIPSKTYKLSNSDLLNRFQIENNNLYVDVDSDIYTERIIGFIDDVDAIKQTVYHILNTERYVYDIYDDNYGVELEQYIGEDFEYLTSTIQETLEEALTQDDRITGVEIVSTDKLDNEKVHVVFNVITLKNEIEMEVDIDV